MFISRGRRSKNSLVTKQTCIAKLGCLTQFFSLRCLDYSTLHHPLDIEFLNKNSVFHFISHDVAEIAGLTTFSFGEDEVDRYVMLFKKVNILTCM